MILYLIRGLPGSGKSTLAKALVGSGQADIHFEADMYHMNNGVYQFKGENVKAGHEWCFTNTKVFLNNGFSVAVSNTFTRISEMQKYLDLANDFPNLEIHIYRCTNDYGNVHNVPPEVIENMRNRFEDYKKERMHWL